MPARALKEQQRNSWVAQISMIKLSREFRCRQLHMCDSVKFRSLLDKYLSAIVRMWVRNAVQTTLMLTHGAFSLWECLHNIFIGLCSPYSGRVLRLSLQAQYPVCDRQHASGHCAPYSCWPRVGSQLARMDIKWLSFPYLVFYYNVPINVITIRSGMAGTVRCQPRM